MESIQNLLQQIGTIRKKNAEILEASGGRFNMFPMCGVKYDENTHTRIITEFLNPQGSHGLKHEFLKCFIEMLGEKFEIKNFICEKARLHNEYTMKDGGRLDILIEDNQNRAIIIENKRPKDDYGDGWKQLIRYNEAAEEKYHKGNYQIFYLTLHGDDASEQSAKGVDYKSISYRDDIINWLEKCVATAARFPMVRETIIQYINYLKKLTNQDMDTKNKEEIVDMIVGNPIFLENAEYIHGAWDDCKMKMIKNLASTIKEAGDKLGLSLYRDAGEGFGITGEYTYISFSKEGWNFSIDFEFRQKTSKLNFGIIDHDRACPEDKIVELEKLLKNLEGYNFYVPTPRWNWGGWILFSAVEEWNEKNWAKRKFTNDFIYQKIKTILDVLEQKYFNQKSQ